MEVFGASIHSSTIFFGSIILTHAVAETASDALNTLTGEERHKLYRMLQLEITPSDEGYEVSGAFCTSGLTLE